MATQIKTLAPRQGWEWLISGYQLFRKKPGEMFLFGNSYLFVILLFSMLIPHLGPVLVTFLTPGLGAGVFLAGKLGQSGMRVTPALLFAGFFQQGKAHLQALLILGSFYSVGFAVVKLLVFLILGPSELANPVNMTADQVPEEAMDYVIAYSALAGLLSLPIVLAFWFAPALVIWHDMPAGKALFASCVATWRNKGAFVIFGMGWLMVSLGFSGFVMFVLGALGMPVSVLGALNLMCVALVMAVSLCSFYPSYRAVFENDIVELTDPTPGV